MKRIAFVDRDGTILAEPPDEQIDSVEKLRFLPGAIRGLRALQWDLGYSLILVSNQDGLGTESFPYTTFKAPQDVMLSVLASEGITFQRICIDPSRPEQNLPTRKPGIAMVEDLLPACDRASSIVIGDRATDITFAQNLGLPCVLLADPSSKPMEGGLATPEWRCTSWDDVVHTLRTRGRRIGIHRVTSETDIRGEICLDGLPRVAISTGIGFFDHMLHQIAVHAGFDLQLIVRGDLHVDAHHTIEDTALALGAALRSTLGIKRGIGRYGFVLPMDDARTLLALDLSDRPFLRWNVSFSGTMVGDFPLSMAEHFFRSFADAARLTLHIESTGTDDHHTIESIFKALGRALRSATGIVDASMPSSKGVLS